MAKIKYISKQCKENHESVVPILRPLTKDGNEVIKCNNKSQKYDKIVDSTTSNYNKFIDQLNNTKTNSLSVVPISRPLTDYRNQFNELEGNRVQEVLFAMNSIREPINTTIRGEITDIKECEIMINKLYKIL